MLLLIIATLVTSVRADEAAMTKYRNYTPKQVSDMPEQQRKSVMPMAYIFAAQKGLAVDSELLFSMQLNLLMYPGIHDYKSAVRAFQADLGDPPTGVLTVYQIHQLEYRSGLQNLADVSFPYSFSSSKTDDYGTVEGTVTILDDRIAWPINHNKIKCFKSENTCEVQQVMLVLPDEKSWAQQYQVMIDSTAYYNVTRWANDTIDAEYPSKPDSCRTVSLSLNFKTKEFFFITKNAGGKCEFLGQKIDMLAKPRISQVVEGKKIFDKEFEKIKKMAYGFLASDFRKKVDQAIALSSKK
ncbi:MAG: hypothetical protein CVU17_05470 [Betaproteobacteria bacterium HGW-Betaproteobacteria-11]|nr:MAG: hypothetical protein CVU17_05470 [Betaproteobacteria bacterium HGW-Betaproteobacteria-11]